MAETAAPRYSILTFGWGAPADSIGQVFPQHEVEFASSARDAFIRSNARAFDAYILDYFAPDWGGAPLCREIRKHDPHVPVIFYSAYADPKAVRRTLRAGADIYLSKQADTDSLATRFAALLHTAERRNTIAQQSAQLAVDAELARLAALAELPGAAALSTQSRLRTTCLAAQKAFIAAGGTRASFDKWWTRAGDTKHEAARRLEFHDERARDLGVGLRPNAQRS